MQLADYIHSDKADQNKIDNTPNELMGERCLDYIKYMGNPLEQLFYPHKVILHSGYRCPELNTLVKGQEHSQHLKGNSLDFHVDGITLRQAYQMIRNSSLFFDQLLLEGKEGHQWIHCSYNTDKKQGEQRKQALELPNA